MLYQSQLVILTICGIFCVFNIDPYNLKLNIYSIPQNHISHLGNNFHYLGQKIMYHAPPM